LNKLSSKGFTLIEILIVLAVMLVINIVVVQWFNLAINKEGIRFQTIQQIGQQRTALDLIAKDIRQAVSIESEFHGIKSSKDKLILKDNRQNRIVYMRDSSHPESLLRIIYDSQGKQIIPMTIHRNLNSINFVSEKNKVMVDLVSAEPRYPEPHLRQYRIIVSLQKEI